MTTEQMESLFEINGYIKVPSNLPEFTFYFRRENQGVIALHVIDYRRGLYISADQYMHLKEKIIEFMRARGEEEVHLLSLILSDDIEKAKQLCVQDSFCWMIDKGSNRLIIHENQVDDFYGWKRILEEFLQYSYAAPAGKERYSNDTGKRTGQVAGRNGGTASASGIAKSPDMKWLKALPWVNICLVAVNVIVFLICTFTGRMLYNKGALGVMYIMEDNSYYRILTSMFLHADIEHLVSNMIVLFYVGEMVEQRMGHVSYTVLYFMSGIAGGVLSMGYELLSGDYSSSVGASGAVFGVEGALLLLVILHHGKLKSISLGRVVFVIAFSLYSGFTSAEINNAAHVGGVLMGFALAAVLSMFRPEHRGDESDAFRC